LKNFKKITQKNFKFLRATQLQIFLLTKNLKLSMSLSDPDEDYTELAGGKKGRVSQAASGMKKYAIVLVIGIIIGLFLQFYFISPIIASAEASTCKDCSLSKLLLNKENECLYKLLPDAKTASEQCGTIAYNEQQASTQKDFNEEAA